MRRGGGHHPPQGPCLVHIPSSPSPAVARLRVPLLALCDTSERLSLPDLPPNSLPPVDTVTAAFNARRGGGHHPSQDPPRLPQAPPPPALPLPTSSSMPSSSCRSCTPSLFYATPPSASSLTTSPPGPSHRMPLLLRLPSLKNLDLLLCVNEVFW